MDIDSFENHYAYDCTYIRQLSDNSNEAYKAFVEFLPMGQVGSSLEKEVLWTAKISAMLTEDCGACVQLNINMALEAGLSKELVQKIVLNADTLNDDLHRVFDFAKAIASNQSDHEEKQKKILELLKPEQLAELSVAIASTKVYPTIKRALGQFKSCSIYNFDFDFGTNA